MSRPRRFGKSVFLSTLEALFAGKRDLFAGLFIEDRWDWQASPVIRIDLLGIQSTTPEAFEQSLGLRLERQAAAHGVSLQPSSPADQLWQLIHDFGGEAAGGRPDRRV